MKIREATVDDAAVISALVYALSERYIAHEFSAEGRHTLLQSMLPAKILEYLESYYRYHVAEIDGQIVGVVGVRDNKHLYHLFVVETHNAEASAGNCGRRPWKPACWLEIQVNLPLIRQSLRGRYMRDLALSLRVDRKKKPVW
jgi:hypothetical protein